MTQLLQTTVPSTPADGEQESYSISIVTDQGQGPFRLGQPVQFSCVIDPTPPEPVTYQWKTVDVYYGRSYKQQKFNVTYSGGFLQQLLLLLSDSNQQDDNYWFCQQTC